MLAAAGFERAGLDWRTGSPWPPAAAVMADTARKVARGQGRLRCGGVPYVVDAAVQAMAATQPADPLRVRASR